MEKKITYRRYKDVTAISTQIKESSQKSVIIISFVNVLGIEDTIIQTDYSTYEYNGHTYTCRYTVEMTAIKNLYPMYVNQLIENTFN